MAKSGKILFLSLIGLIFFAGSVSADLGISPSDWTELNAMPGQNIEKTFYLSRSDTSDSLDFSAKISGDIIDWIKIKNSNNFTMPQGQQQYAVDVVLNIPKNAEKKNYKSEIRLSSSSNAPQSGQIGVQLGALIRINLTVSDKQVLDYVVQQVEIPIQETGKYVDVVLDITNKGNVEAKPTKVAVDFFDKYYAKKLSSETVSDFSKIKGVAHFSQGKITVPVPAQLEPGQYWADVNVFQGENNIKSDHLTFEIVEAGTLKKINNNIFVTIAIIAVSLLIIIAVIVFIIIWKKRKNI
jgi:hypothetical protein